MSQISTHFTRSSFDAALPEGTIVNELNFDSLVAGSTVSNGETIQDIQFSFDFGDVLLSVVDSGTTTSSPNFLGTNDLDLLQDGDNIDFIFPDAIAVGLNIISADELLDDDLTLTFLDVPVSLVGLDVEQTLSDGSTVHFLGITSTDESAITASLATIGGGFFLYNIDNIVVVSMAPIILGDINQDGLVNLLDVEPFIGVINSGTFQSEADCNEDGVVNLLDVEPFIALLSG